MIKKIKSVFFIVWWIFFIFQTNIVNALRFWEDKVISDIEWSQQSADVAIQGILVVAMSFLYLLAVIYWLWWGFNVMTAGWDEEKVKNIFIFNGLFFLL